MENINFKDIDFSKLKEMESQGSKSVIYRNENTCYKILTDLFQHEKKELYKKFLEMDGLKIDNVLMPSKLIIHEGELEGYTMEYFPNSMCLYDKFLMGRYVKSNELLESFKKASEILKQVHKNNIIYEDISFSNILVDNNGEVRLCDIDGCCYNGHKGPFTPAILNKFIIEYRNEEINVSENSDKLAIMLSLVLLLYRRQLQNLPKEEYHWLADNITSINNMKQYFDIILDKNQSIPDIPYLHELINLNDNYIIDREAQTEFVKKLGGIK